MGATLEAATADMKVFFLVIMKIQTLKQENIESYLNRASEYGSEYAASEEICHDLEHLEEAEQSDGGLFLSNSSGDHSACDAVRGRLTGLRRQNPS